MYTEQRGSSLEPSDSNLKKDSPKISRIREIKQRSLESNRRIQTPGETNHNQALADRVLEASNKSIATIKKTIETSVFEPKFEKLLGNIETQIAEQREEIVRLQSIYDKAWLGRGKKLKELEAAKTKKTELLKKRNEIQKKTGLDIDIDEKEFVEPPLEKKFEKRLENIEKEIVSQRQEIVQLQSVYDKAWFGRGEKLKRLEEAKTKRTNLLKQRSEITKELEELRLRETIRAKGLDIKTYTSEPEDEEPKMDFRERLKK